MGIEIAQVKTLTELLPKRGPAIYHAGTQDGDKGHDRYAHPSSTNPNLMIVNPIFDDDGNVIYPGYYELVLSEDRQMLVLLQQRKEVAIFPVFKIEEEKQKKEAIAQPRSFIEQKKYNIKKKREEKKTKKMIKEGKILNEPEIYTNATIEYEENGNYYLIKYERGNVRAWGAIK